MKDLFKAIVVDNQNQFLAKVKEVHKDFLEKNDVLVKVKFSTINFKDALAITNKGKIINSFPFIPGIDFAGIVKESNNPEFKKGDAVISTGYGVGEKYLGGLGEYISAKSSWLNKLPKDLSLEDSMFIGTAGFTAMLCVEKLINNNLTPEDGEVLVSGASGGVGSFAVAILHSLGFNVVAISSKKQDYLTSLGADRILDTKDFLSTPRALAKQAWSGGIDVVGDKVLANMLSQMNYGAPVAACGLAGGYQLNTTVMPFILRGVSLLGVDSVYYPSEKREKIWARFAEIILQLNSIYKTSIYLTEVVDYANKMMDGKTSGRCVVKIS